MSRYARKVDGSHRKVVEAFEHAGCSVAVIQSHKAGLPDIVIGVCGSTHLVEIKNDTRLKKDAPSLEQVGFAAKWRGSPVHLIRSPVEAVALVNLLRMTAATRAKAAALLAHSSAGAA